MIISASYRTDIPAFYADWFAARLDAGFCEVTNPYNGKPYRVSLTAEDARAFVFWTRNAGPLMPQLTGLAGANRPFSNRSGNWPGCTPAVLSGALTQSC